MRTWANTKTRHGTPSGFRFHQNLGEDPCPMCWEAKSAYDKRRLKSPIYRIRNRQRARAQFKAYQALARRDRAEYERLYRAFLAEIERQDEAG